MRRIVAARIISSPEPRTEDRNRIRLRASWLLSMLVMLALVMTYLGPAPATASATLRTDTFVRANSTSGWGIASDGNTWALLSGSSASGGTVGITTNQGTLASSTSSLFNVLGGTVSSADQQGLVRWSVGSTSGTAGILLRARDNNNYYLARYGGNGLIQLYVKVNGVTTRSTAFSFTPTVGTLYWMRFQVKGTALSIKVWQDRTPEPASWGYTTTDTQLGSPGSVGLYGCEGRCASGSPALPMKQGRADSHARGRTSP